MTSTPITPVSPVEPSDLLLVRSYEVDVTEGDGRTLDLRLVPYNTPTLVADAPDFRPYREAFLPGAFQAQSRAADRVKVWLNFEHEQGLRGIVGHGVTLRDSNDDLQGSFRVHENADGDKALQMVRDGLLSGASIEFSALRSKTVDGVVQRVKARLDKVSLCRFPAYETAEVLAIRQATMAAAELSAEAILQQMNDLARRYLAIEPDAPDKAEMQAVMARLEALLAKDKQDAQAARTLMPAADMERLQMLGIAPILLRTVVRKPWDGSAARFTDEQYQASCLIDRGGDAPAKERCSLPVLEPDGDLNVNALGPAAAALSGARTSLVGVTTAGKAAAARKLIRYYRQANLTPPQPITNLAAQ